MQKTNVMRLLDQKKIPYSTYDYSHTGALSGTEVAAVLKQEALQVFKTLVAVGASGKYYVFMVPVCKELHLKKAAQIAGEKKIEMLKEKNLLPLTGYVHGGCSPIGMKKLFPTFIDRQALSFPSIIFSGGKIGCQVELSLEELKKVIPFRLGDLTDSPASQG